MEIRESFCSNCGKWVRLAAAPGPTLHGHANLPDGGEVVCLDYEGRCSDGWCVASGRPGVVMAYRLARSHLADDRWPRIRARCSACGNHAELERLDTRHVFCTMCETTSLLKGAESVEA